MCLSSWEHPSNNPLNKDSSILSGSLSSNYIGGLYNQMSLFYYFTVKTRPCVSHCWSTWVGVVLRVEAIPGYLWICWWWVWFKSSGYSRIPPDFAVGGRGLTAEVISGYLFVLVTWLSAPSASPHLSLALFIFFFSSSWLSLVVAMDEEYDVIVLGTGLKVRETYKQKLIYIWASLRQKHV